MTCCKCVEYGWRDQQPVVYRDGLDKRGYCLFHAPAMEKGETLNEFNKEVYARIDDSIKDKRDCNLMGTIFPGDISFSQYGRGKPLPEIDFEKACFEGNVRFDNAELNGSVNLRNIVANRMFQFEGATCADSIFLDLAVFHSRVSFNQSIFEGDISIQKVVFEKSVYWKEVTFEGQLKINSARFKSYCFFTEALFRKDVSFFKTTFHSVDFGWSKFFGSAGFFDFEILGHAKFEETQFHGTVNFTKINFNMLAYFKKVRFIEKLIFNWCCFCDKTEFVEVTFESDVLFETVDFGKNFRFESILCSNNVEFTNVVFNNAQISTNTPDPSLIFLQCSAVGQGLSLIEIDLRHCDFIYCHLENIQFIKSPWPKIGGRYHIRMEDVDDPEWQTIHNFYQSMKRKYKEEHNEYEASKWHVAEKEAQMKLLAQNDETKWLRRMLWAYKQSSGFGENPSRAFVGLLLFVLIPLLVLIGIDVWHHFEWWDFDSVKVNKVIKEWLKFIPLTRAIGPDEAGGLHALMELWQLGVTIQAALFGFALRNKFRR